MSRGMSSSSFDSVSGDNPPRRRASACSTCVRVASVRAARSASAGGRGRGPSAARVRSSMAISFSSRLSSRAIAIACAVDVAASCASGAANTVSTLPPRSGGEGGRASADASPGGGSLQRNSARHPRPGPIAQARWVHPSPPLAALAGGGESPPLRGGRVAAVSLLDHEPPATPSPHPAAASPPAIRAADRCAVSIRLRRASD